MFGQPEYLRESSGVWAGGVWSPIMINDGRYRILLTGAVTVTFPVGSNGITPASEIIQGRRYQFVFEQGAGGAHAVVFNPIYYKLTQNVPDCNLATLGQRLSVWFRYEADTAMWMQDSPFLGWSNVDPSQMITNLNGEPLYRCTITAATGVPKDNTNSPTNTYTLTAGQVVMLQSDVTCWVEVIASASMTAAGGKALLLEANEKYVMIIKTGGEKISVDCSVGSCNVKVFTLEV
jgi:hypothetical protein